jgi:hypothetical protein
MGDFSFEDFNFGSGNEEYDFSGLSDIGLGTDVQELDLSSLFSGDGGGIDLSSLDMGPEAFDISSLLGGGDGKEIDFSKIDMHTPNIKINKLENNFFNTKTPDLFLDNLISLKNVTFNNAELALSIFIAFKEII